MPMIDRLMHVEEPIILVHEFYAAVTEVIFNGQTYNGVTVNGITAAQLRTHFSIPIDDPDFLALAAQIPASNQTTTAAQLARLVLSQRWHSVFLLAGHRAQSYATPAEVRARLGI